MGASRRPPAAARRRLGSGKWAVIGVLAVCIALGGGCNGGSGGSSGGTGGGGGDARAALFDSISAKLLSFDGTNPDQENQELLRFVRTKPEIIDSGVASSGGVWAILKDGRALVIANNVDRNPTRPVVTTKSHATLTTQGAGLPTTGVVDIGTSFGSFFDLANQDIAQMFLDGNYDPVSDPASVQTLQTLNNVGVLYLTAHGVICPVRRGGAPVFVAWTSTPRARDGTSDAAYAADLNDGSLTYFVGLTFNGDQNGLVRRAEAHYGITFKFVTKHWTGKFNPNSLVFMNACSSASPDALEFGLACLQAGASAYVGWTDTMVIRDGVVSAAYFFDRLLGANAVDPVESPPQRAFAWGAVLSEMATRTRPYNSSKYDTTVNPHTGRAAKLMPLLLNGQFAQLAPSIESLEVDEQSDELIVFGLFGDPRGDVFMNDSPLTIKSWTTNEIRCVLPRSGALASGDVYVLAGAPRQKSNIVQLTEWKGTVTCTFQAKGTLKMVWTFNVHFRADVHDRRIAPHEAPVMPGASYLQALDTSGTYVFSGVYVDPTHTNREEWSGAGSVPSFVKPPAGTSPPPVTNVIVQGAFDSSRHWSMSVDATAVKGNRVHRVTYDASGKVTSDTTEVQDAAWLSLGDMNGNLNLATASTGYDIPGGTATQAVNTEESLTLKWSAMPAKNPPDAVSARGAVRPD